ncbi:hypothetical protein DQ384_12770 [Sphaerisporangium album]|uniref:Uncharacterized protein n=1 Tax=Sphaerisporangium album TaxID=509200 RepID=A0A367FKB8_9ACTN|nr:hypothetical protein [Sphaerisporangium album]RCG30843.1 hypothetical protein DQ384_12770 [Sphaerisporangium album]
MKGRRLASEAATWVVETVSGGVTRLRDGTRRLRASAARRLTFHAWRRRIRAGGRTISARLGGGLREGWRRLASAAGRYHPFRGRRLTLSGGERPRSLVTSLLLGGVLVGLSYSAYVATISPPNPPVVEGTGEIYLDTPAVPTRLAVNFPPADARQGRSRVEIDIVFVGPRSKPVRWALVLYGDARFTDPGVPAATLIPPGATIVSTKAGKPPFAANPKENVQVISGIAYPAYLNGQASAPHISGWLPVGVVSAAGPTFSLSLPRYGRVQLSPLFQFPRKPGALDIGIPGTWKRPDQFEVIVDAGGNDTGQRIDVASPDIEDPARLHWESDVSVRALLRRTDVRKETGQQFKTFLMGAVVGAGASSLVVALEKLLGSVRIARGGG